MKDTIELSRALDNFYGCDQPFYNPLYPRMSYTDGVKFFAENAGGGAYWFLDIVGTEYHPKQNPEDPFMVIRLVVGGGGKARVYAHDGNDNEVMPPKLIDFTDCPYGEWKFYLEGDMLLLPGEH